MNTITVNAGRPYDVIVGCGLLGSCGKTFRALTKASTLALVTDDIVDVLYSDAVTVSLEAEGFSVKKFVFPTGEESKTLETLGRLYNFLAEEGVTRTDAIAALGGGVVGDLAGLAAATFLRGVDFFQIPTTLLAQVDSSVGGKTAVDLPMGKNLVGAFYQPKAVICDTDTLSTLSAEIFSDGMGEVIKYGMIKDEKLFKLLENGGISDRLEEIISACIAIKRDTVVADEFDRGERILLNFGHTLGHAIEKAHGFTGISHGRAVAAGMALITKIAEEKGFTKIGTSARLEACLKTYALPCTDSFSVKKLLPLCFSDKKIEGDTIGIVLCSNVGESFVQRLTLHGFKEFLGG